MGIHTYIHTHTHTYIHEKFIGAFLSACLSNFVHFPHNHSLFLPITIPLAKKRKRGRKSSPTYKMPVDFFFFKRRKYEREKNVQKLQNFAAKVAKGNAKKYDQATPIIQELGWLKVKEKHELETCITVFKVLNGFY